MKQEFEIPSCSFFFFFFISFPTTLRAKHSVNVNISEFPLEFD